MEEKNNKNGPEVQICYGNPLKLKGDGIFCPVNSELYPTTDFDDQMLKYYGENFYIKTKMDKGYFFTEDIITVKEESKEISNILLGFVPDISFKKWPNIDDIVKVQHKYFSALERANFLKIKTLIIPNFYQGSDNGWDLETTVELVMKMIITFTLADDVVHNIDKIYYVLRNKEEYEYVQEYIKRQYMENFLFLEPEVNALSMESVTWETKKVRGHENSYPVYAKEIGSIYEKLRKYLVIGVSKIPNEKINILEIAKILKENPEKLSTTNIIKYIEYVYKQELKEDGFIAREINKGVFIPMLKLLVKRQRLL